MFSLEESLALEADEATLPDCSVLHDNRVTSNSRGMNGVFLFMDWRDRFLQVDFCHNLRTKLPRLPQRGRGSVISCLLALDGCNARKNLALNGLKERTTTSGDIAYLISKAELGAACHRVTTTDERESTLGSSLGNGITDSL